MLRDKHELGSRLVIFKCILSLSVVVTFLSGQSSAMVCQDQFFLAADWTSNETVQYNTNVTSHADVTYTPMDNSTFSVGRHNITATLNGSTDCTFILVVLANPICPTNVSQPSDENLTTTSVIWSYPAENRIDLFPLTSNPVNGTTFNLGVTDVIVSLTDYPEYTCAYRVEVTDEEPPQLTCPDSLDVNNSALATWRVPMASDNSGNVLLTSTHRPGGYFPFNVSTEITYTAVDSSGNSANCSFNLTVVRDGSPEITNCPSNVNKMIPLGITDTTVTELWIQEPSATSPTASFVNVSSDYNRNSIFGLGTTRVTYTFTDAAGTSSKCRFLVSVTQSPDGEAPEVENNIECPSDVVQDALPGTTEIPVTWVQPIFVDAVDGNDITVSQTKESGNAFGPGTTEVLYVATDKSYNILQCIIRVTVNVTEDNDPPVITGCPNNITEWVGPTVPNVTIPWTTPNATDNFQVATFISSHEPGSKFTAGGQTKVNYTATDLVGNQDICAFYVIINVDSEPPVIINCPEDINEFVAEMVNALEVTWKPPNITDNSGMFEVVSSHESGNTYPAPSVFPVVIDAVDEAGNVAVQCTFTVTVTVDLAPNLMCPSIVPNDTVQGQAYSIVWWLDGISVTDDYTNLTRNSTEVNPLQVDLNSPIMVTYTVEDIRGNVQSCTFQVVANDTEPPVWTPCPSNMTVPANPGTNSATVSWDAPSVSDNSGETPIEITTPRSSQLFSGGTYTVVYSAEDTAGNTGTCQFDVTVTVDSDVPTFANCPTGPLVFNTPTGQSTAIVTWGNITAIDTADGGLPVTSNINPGDELPIMMHDVLYQATDSSGNVAMCPFTVEVRDAEPPVIISCPDDIIVYALAQRGETPVTWTTQAAASDNSGSVILSSTPSSGSLFITADGQMTTVEYSAMDPSENPSLNTCSFTVTVRTTDLISIRGVVTLDSIRGNGNFPNHTEARELLEMDLADLLRGTSLAPVDFVDVLVTNSVNSDSNFRASFTLFFSPNSHRNEEEIKDIFYNALGNRVSFDSANVIVSDSFDLTVREFSGEFTLRSIVPSIDAVDFTSCCSDPSSASYQALLQTIYSYFDATFGSMHLFRMSRILPLRQGSVVIPYILTFDGASTVTLNDIEQAFNATVQDPSRELAQTDLFLTVNDGVGDTVEVCPAGYCNNGGTCDVTSSDTYAFGCSCRSGFSGTQCESTTRQLSTAEIIGIFLGVLGLILILMVVCCCCCFWLMGRTSRRYDGDEEDLVGKAPPPMLLLPMDEEYFRRQPRRQQRPIITEMPPEEPAPRPYRPPSPPPPPSGPSFLHEDPLFVPPPQPLPPPQPMIYPPPPQHRRPRRSPPRQRKELPSSYYETEIVPQPPQLSRQILLLPPTAPRWRRMRDRIDRYLPIRGPRFRGSRRPEPIVSDELPVDYYDGAPIRRYGSAPNYRGDYGPQPLPPSYHRGGGPIRRFGSRRSDAPRFKGNDVPEQVGDMKRRLFYEFNY